MLFSLIQRRADATIFSSEKTPLFYAARVILLFFQPFYYTQISANRNEKPAQYRESFFFSALWSMQIKAWAIVFCPGF